MASRKLSSSSSSPSFMLPLVRPGSFGTLMMMMMMITTMIPCQQVNFVGGLAAVPMPSLDNNKMEDYIPLAEEAMQYFDASPDPFHVVQTSTKMLLAAGFQELDDCVPYSGKIVPGGKYFFTRNKSTIVAFAVGDKFEPGNGFKIIGGHSDSPNLKVKTRSKRSNQGVTQIGVECYGGGLWHTWFDRDLGISGRVLVRNKGSGAIEQRLVMIDRALVRVSTLAIHLQTTEEREAFKINKEDELSPIIAMEAEKVLNGDKEEEEGEDDGTGWTKYQEPLLLEVLANELGVNVDDIADFELNLFDAQKASLGGARSEFLHSARLDNQATCFIATKALAYHVESGGLTDDGDVSLIILFDHEEIGSASAVGAGSPIMAEAVERISAALNGGSLNVDVNAATLRKSFVLSVDNAHAVHPNYASKHEVNHQPKMNDGMVIKRNSNQRYATNSVTGLLMREVARRAGLPPVQEFMVRNDCPCGSTIGPIISTATGIRAIDMGMPQLSMHSCRETMGISDLTHGLNLFNAFFSKFREVDSSVQQ